MHIKASFMLSTSIFPYHILPGFSKIDGLLKHGVSKISAGSIHGICLCLLSNRPHQKLHEKTVMSCPAPLFSKYESAIPMVSSPTFCRYFEKGRNNSYVRSVCQNIPFSIPMHCQCRRPKHRTGIIIIMDAAFPSRSKRK